MTRIEYKGWSRSRLMTLVAVERHRHPSLRYGQALYNVAYRENPAVAKLAGTECDPFHDDSKAEAFLEKLQAK